MALLLGDSIRIPRVRTDGRAPTGSVGERGGRLVLPPEHPAVRPVRSAGPLDPRCCSGKVALSPDEPRTPSHVRFIPRAGRTEAVDATFVPSPRPRTSGRVRA